MSLQVQPEESDPGQDACHAGGGHAGAGLRTGRSRSCQDGHALCQVSLRRLQPGHSPQGAQVACLVHARCVGDHVLLT